MTDNYGPAHWRPSPNFTSQQRTIDMIIVHDCEGLYEPSIIYLAKPSTQASAHFILRSSDGDVSQMVHEADVAWHSGNEEYNVRSIGIEHEGYARDPGRWYTDAMLQASAKLVAMLCQRYNITPSHTGNSPGARGTIIGHWDVPSEDGLHWGGSSRHTDPGPGWDWPKYIALIKAAMGTGTPPPAGPQPAGWVLPHLVSLEVDGLVLSGELAEVYADVTSVQYFERAKFEKHQGGSVTRALLGAQAYQAKQHSKLEKEQHNGKLDSSPRNQRLNRARPGRSSEGQQCSSLIPAGRGECKRDLRGSQQRRWGNLRPGSAGRPARRLYHWLGTHSVGD